MVNDSNRENLLPLSQIQQYETFINEVLRSKLRYLQLILKNLQFNFVKMLVVFMFFLSGHV